MIETDLCAEAVVAILKKRGIDRIPIRGDTDKSFHYRLFKALNDLSADGKMLVEGGAPFKVSHDPLAPESGNFFTLFKSTFDLRYLIPDEFGLAVAMPERIADDWIKDMGELRSMFERIADVLIDH